MEEIKRKECPLCGASAEVHWSRPGPCPIMPEQFDAIYNDDEEEANT